MSQSKIFRYSKFEDFDGQVITVLSVITAQDSKFGKPVQFVGLKDAEGKFFVVKSYSRKVVPLGKSKLQLKQVDVKYGQAYVKKVKSPIFVPIEQMDGVATIYQCFKCKTTVRALGVRYARRLFSNHQKWHNKEQLDQIDPDNEISKEDTNGQEPEGTAQAQTVQTQSGQNVHVWTDNDQDKDTNADNEGVIEL